MSPPRLVLASTSPYRRDLLARLRLPFEVVAPEVDEHVGAGETPAATATRLASAKADAVAALHPDAVVIGSDQVADLDGRAIGKPGDHAHATAQLRLMRGRTVIFQTGVSVVCRASGFAASALVPVTVRFRALADAEIERYLRAEAPYDCAGSAKIETLGIALVESVACDDPTALVGLPLIRTCELLRRAGIDPLGDGAAGPRVKANGTLYLVPNGLDVGTGEADADLADRLPLATLRRAAQLGHWVCENAKTTRAFLKRVDAVCPLARPLQETAIVELPRPPKGRPDTIPFEGERLLAPALAGSDLGLVCEAGLPAVADPGAPLVAAAHAAGVRVVALPGASSITLAVAASGLNGQSFAFVGYLPIEAEARHARIRELEATSRRLAQTQLMIETPYRNPALLAALLAHLQPATTLSVSLGLTLTTESTRSESVERWRRRPGELRADVPAVFALLAR